MLLSAFGYAGEWTDRETGYSYLRMRWLDTFTGTFLSEDPLVQDTHKAFGYTEGSPITQIDPLGLRANEIANMNNSSAMSWINKDTVSTMGTVLGGISSIAAIASLTPLAPIAAPIAAIAGAASLVLGSVATISTCLDTMQSEVSKPTKACQWGIASTIVSAIPIVGRLGKIDIPSKVKLMGRTNKHQRLGSTPEAPSKKEACQHNIPQN